MRKFLIFFVIVFFAHCLGCAVSCKSPPPVIEIVEEAAEPEPAAVIAEAAEIEPEIVVPAIEILEPVFSIVSIMILQADLVVTEFETILRVENPNIFAVELSSINYELYGNGTFWTNGRENNIFFIPANSTNETKFTFKMNFIDMNRRLLDDVIAMRQINYRFKGQAHAKPDIASIPAFIADFDCSGLSSVSPR